jgi:hypothetical protein
MNMLISEDPDFNKKPLKSYTKMNKISEEEKLKEMLHWILLQKKLKFEDKHLKPKLQIT